MAGAPNTHVCYHPRRTARREAAQRRAAQRLFLTPAQQLAELDFRLGFNAGAKRERAKLARLLRNP